MFLLKNLLLVGSYCKDAGKTEFICRIIKHILKKKVTVPIIGIKFNVIHKYENYELYGKSCFNKFDIQQDYIDNKLSCNKDTNRILQSGGDVVFWVRVFPEFIDECIFALVDTIKSKMDHDINKCCIICESNTMRLSVHPGLFLIINPKNNNYIKQSCRNIINFADRIITFEKSYNNFEFNFDNLNFKNSHWYLQEEATVIILAGGNSSRFESDKYNIFINNLTMLQHICISLKFNFKQIIISVGTKDKLLNSIFFNDFTIVEDEFYNKGPISGILSALKYSNNNINFITTCDNPFNCMSYVRKALNIMYLNSNLHAVIPYVNNIQNVEPLFAIYNKLIMIDLLEKYIKKDNIKLSKLLEYIKCYYIKLLEFEYIFNINSREDFNSYLNFSSKYFKL